MEESGGDVERVRGRKEREKLYLCYPCSQKGSDEEFEAFEFRLYDDEVEVCGWIHGSRHVFYGFDLIFSHRVG